MLVTLRGASVKLLLLLLVGGSSNTPSRFTLRKPELSTGPMGHLGPYKGLPYLLLILLLLL